MLPEQNADAVNRLLPGPAQLREERLGGGQVQLGLADVELRRDLGPQSILGQPDGRALGGDILLGVLDATLERP